MSEETNQNETPAPSAAPAAPVATQPLPSQQVPPAPAQQPTPNPMPPTYQQPTYQQQPAQPVAAPAPLTQLSGGMKFGWFVIGVLVGIPGILIAWLANVDKLPQVKADAVKFSAIGLVVWAVLWALACLGFLSIVAAVLSSLFGDFSSSYGMYY